MWHGKLVTMERISLSQYVYLHTHLTSMTHLVLIQITAETTGWVGLGVSPNGAMTGADIIVAWVDSSGSGHIEDRYGTGNTLPPLDDSQDVQLISSSQTAGETTVTFTRLINTCDQQDNRIVVSCPSYPASITYIQPSVSL